MAPPTSGHWNQRDFAEDQGRRCVRTICAAWDAALEATQARGYPTASPGPSAAPPSVSQDDDDPLHTRHGALIHQSGGFCSSDSTGNAAMTPDAAAAWLSGAKRTLSLLARFLPDDAESCDGLWVGPFDPPALVDPLMDAVSELVDIWPRGVGRLLSRLVGLANQASAAGWGPPPKAGEVVDGVVVGRRESSVETCVGCGRPVAGGVADPIRRKDGKPYHGRSCYYRAWRADRDVRPWHGDGSWERRRRKLLQKKVA